MAGRRLDAYSPKNRAQLRRLARRSATPEHEKLPPFPAGPYDVVYADPPWYYYGSKIKDAAAAKHYPLMTLEDLARLPVRRIMAERAALFLWATCPRLNFALDVIARWGLHYRGVAYVWVKTNARGEIIRGQGISPTFTKPTVELVLAATTMPTGRPFPLRDFAQGQVVLHPRGAHSEKPAVVRTLIEALLGNRKRIELFARTRVPHWDAWGGDLSEL